MKKLPLYPVYPIATLRDLLDEIVDRYQGKVALQSKKHGNYEPTTYSQLGRRVEELGNALLALDLEKGDRVGILGPNCTEWVISYLGTVCSGLVAVPVDKDLTPREIGHILEYSETSVLICSGDYIDSIGADGQVPETLRVVVSMDDEAGSAQMSFPEFLQTGYDAVQGPRNKYREAEVSRSDLAAIIFTSGTTGSSKAVMLTHGNLSSNIVGTSQHVFIGADDRLLSVLPLHHTYECTCGFLTALYQGATIFHAENLRRLADNLVESRATVMLGVPLLFESIYRRIRKGISEKGERKFNTAKRLANLADRLLRVDIRRRLFSELHQRFGGHLTLLISGGAAGNPEVARGFRDLGINFIQGYGMTEASPLVAVNRVGECKDSSVGRPIPGVEVRIDDNGEILVKGPNVMSGYYKNPAASSEILRDEWLHTGDLGYFDKDGHLYINGRLKSLIVTPNGKNVYPEEIEALLNESDFILESLVWGGPESDPSQVEVQAIIVPDTDAFDNAFGASRYDQQEIREIIANEVKRCNGELATYKRIKKFTLRDTEFEKTTTRKIKRYLYTGKPQTVQNGR